LHEAYHTKMTILMDGLNQSRDINIMNQNKDPKSEATAMNTTTGTNRSKPDIYNIVGGYVAWQQQVDVTFPRY
jgi:hypothetical protein